MCWGTHGFWVQGGIVSNQALNSCSYELFHEFLRV